MICYVSPVLWKVLYAELFGVNCLVFCRVCVCWGGGSRFLLWTFQVIQGSFEKPKQSPWIIQPWEGVGMRELEDKIY